MVYFVVCIRTVWIICMSFISAQCLSSVWFSTFWELQHAFCRIFSLQVDFRSWEGGKNRCFNHFLNYQTTLAVQYMRCRTKDSIKRTIHSKSQQTPHVCGTVYSIVDRVKRKPWAVNRTQCWTATIITPLTDRGGCRAALPLNVALKFLFYAARQRFHAGKKATVVSPHSYVVYCVQLLENHGLENLQADAELQSLCWVKRRSLCQFPLHLKSWESLRHTEKVLSTSPWDVCIYRAVSIEVFVVNIY